MNRRVARLAFIKNVMTKRDTINAYEVSIMLNCSVTLAYQLLHQLALLEPNTYEYDRGILRKKVNANALTPSE